MGSSTRFTAGRGYKVGYPFFCDCPRDYWREAPEWFKEYLGVYNCIKEDAMNMKNIH